MVINFSFTIAHSFEKDTIPYLIQMLLTQDGILRSTAAIQMRWAEKNFATQEMFYDMGEWQHSYTSHCALWPERFWPIYRSHRSFGNWGRKDHDAVLHCPIPQLLLCDTSVYGEECPMGILRILMHFCDFLFPLFGATGSELDKVSSRMPAVHRVNDFLKTR